MSDSSCTITFLTPLPIGAMLPVHWYLLEAMGYERYTSNDDPRMTMIWGADTTDYLTPEDFDVHKSDDSVISHRLMAWVNDCKLTAPTMPDVVQDMVATLEAPDLPHVDIMASYGSFKARPGEHGGWAMRVDADGLRYQNTSLAFEAWDKEAEKANTGPERPSAGDSLDADNYPGMKFRVAGPMDDGERLYWAMNQGWVSAPDASLLTYSQATTGLLLGGATRVEIVSNMDVQAIRDACCTQLRHAEKKLLDHGVEAMTALVCSTAHATAEEREQLTLESCPGEHLTVSMQGAFGSLFYIDLDLEDLSGHITEGLSSGFAGAINYARQHGFAWLRMDSDGPCLPGVETYLED